MNFKSNLDFLAPILENKVLKEKDIPEYLVKWLKPLKEEIVKFRTQNKTNNLHELNFKPKEVNNHLILFYNWLSYFYNTIIYIDSGTFVLGEEISSKIRNDVLNYIFQIIEIAILKLNEFNIATMNKYQKKHIRDVSDEIMKYVPLIKEDLFKLAECLVRFAVHKEEITENLVDLKSKMSRVMINFNSLINMNKGKEKSTKLKELLIEFNLNQALNRLEKAEGSFNSESWDKAVADMRLVLEMTVIHLVRVILNDNYWNKPFKEGIEILRINGIIKDEITKKHFCDRNISVYGALSMKGHHADGTSDANLANSELEAKYFMSLTENVIEYLLASFRESGFYESEDSDS